MKCASSRTGAANASSSAVGIALQDAIQKHNDRNPGKEIVYLNYAAVDPDMTNSKCNYWHFRLDANSDMKMEALTSYLAKDQNIKKVYLLNQNYSFGHQVARAAKEYLKRKRPDIQVVGEDLHPLAQVKDFSPYVAKIRASGADTVITGNWGSDLALLIRAAKDAGLNTNFYTYYAGTTGVPTAMGASGADRVKVISYFAPNNGNPKTSAVIDGFKKKYNDDFYTGSIIRIYQFLGAAMAKAVKEQYGEQIKELFGLEVVVPTTPFPVVKLADLYKGLEEEFGYTVDDSEKGDLTTEAERLSYDWVKKHYGHEFLFITDYSAEKRAFYHMRDENGVPQGYDLIWRGVEITTGAQREHRYEVLKKQAEEKGLAEDVKFYLEFFQYGCPPHGGFGLGIDRLTMLLVGESIKDAEFLFRGPNRLTP